MTLIWFEVAGKDGKKLQDFFSGLFGWKLDNFLDLQPALSAYRSSIHAGVAGDDSVLPVLLHA